MEDVKTCLPDLLQSRVDELVDVQAMDEETRAHMRDLAGRLEDLTALAREDAAETALTLAEEVRQLCARIRRDFVTMAYRQGMRDGTRLREVLVDPAETLPR